MTTNQSTDRPLYEMTTIYYVVIMSTGSAITLGENGQNALGHRDFARTFTDRISAQLAGRMLAERMNVGGGWGHFVTATVEALPAVVTYS